MSYMIFTPVGATVNLAVTGTTGRVALNKVTTASRSVRVHNAGAATAFINFGGSTVEAAVASSLPLPPGAVEWFEIGDQVTNVAAITSAGSTTIYATEGFGS